MITEFSYRKTTLLRLADKTGRTLFVGTLRQIRRRLRVIFKQQDPAVISNKLTTEGFTISDANHALLENPDAPYTTEVKELKAKLTTIPHKPGVYLFKDKDGRVIYVGKAKNLRSRVGQYFSGHDNRPQLPFLMQDAADLDFTVVNSELESLFLENTLIKEYLPQYNIKLRDDKNYAFITIDYTVPIPKIDYARKIESTNKQVKYFGPYSSAKKIRQTLDFIRRVFPYCSNTEIGKRPCFYYFLHRCPGVCVGLITLEEYNQQLERIMLFLNGRTEEIKKQLKVSMKKSAGKKQFELAAKLRDQLRALEVLDERQVTIFPSKVNWDFVSVIVKGPTACANVFRVREGKLIDKENFIYDATSLPTYTDAETYILQKCLEDYYSVASDYPKEVYIQTEVENRSIVEQLLKTRSTHSIKMSVPTRGQKLNLIELGKTNATEYLRKWENTQATNLDTIHEALQNLQNILNLPTLPRRIEGYDISNTQGTNPVGSMVVTKDGIAAKSEYRKFKIKIKDTPDDFAMMREMLTRRLSRLAETLPPDKQKDAWPTPDLIVIDGGKGQLGVTVEVLDALGLHIPVIGLAKRIEEIFLPHNPVPIILPHDNPTLQLLQRLRDEAHRFGITFHRSLRSKQATQSALDTISGVGPKTKKLLKQKFGTVAQIRQTSLEDLTAIVGKAKAEQIKKSI